MNKIFTVRLNRNIQHAVLRAKAKRLESAIVENQLNLDFLQSGLSGNHLDIENHELESVFQLANLLKEQIAEYDKIRVTLNELSIQESEEFRDA